MSMMMTPKWKLVVKAPRDHRVFENLNTLGPDDRYAVTDWSGAWPEKTDDGILWLVPHGAAEIYASPTKHIYVNYSVKVVRNSSLGNTASGLHVLPILKELGYKFTFEKSLEHDLCALIASGIGPFARGREDAAYEQSMREFLTLAERWED